MSTTKKKKKKRKRQTAYSAATTPKSTRSSHTDITSELTLTGSCTLIDVGRVEAFSTLREIECESIMSMGTISSTTRHIKQTIRTHLYGLCPGCHEPKIDQVWCGFCLTPHVSQSWTSGDRVLDEFIRNTQKNVRDYHERFLEWVPWERIGEIRVRKDKSEQKYGKAFINNKNSAGLGIGKRQVAVWFDGERDRRIGDRTAPVKVILEPLDCDGFFTSEYLEKLIKKYPFITSPDNYTIYGFTYNPSLLHPLGSSLLSSSSLPNSFSVSSSPTRATYFLLINYRTPTLTELYSLCLYCHQPKLDPLWCASNACELPSFNPISSDNSEIDEFVWATQRIVKKRPDTFLEYVPFRRFKNIRKIGMGCYSVMYEAIWKDGKRKAYEKGRTSEIKVALKLLKGTGSENTSRGFFDELKTHYLRTSSAHIYFPTLYGISQDPSTGELILVTQFAANGTLRDYIRYEFPTISWHTKLSILKTVVSGLNSIHELGMAHGNLHSGNVLRSYGSRELGIADEIGTESKCENPNDEHSDVGSNNDAAFSHPSPVKGVLPYLSPESLHSFPPTPSSDIYSLGILMSELMTGTFAFSSRAHDYDLAHDICLGLRPKLDEDIIPRKYIDVVKQCLNAQSEERPSAESLCDIFEDWSKDEVMYEAFLNMERKTEKVEDDSKQSDGNGKGGNAMHDEVIYHSRVFAFHGLPTPVNDGLTNIDVKDNQVA